MPIQRNQLSFVVDSIDFAMFSVRYLPLRIVDTPQGCDGSGVRGDLIPEWFGHVGRAPESASIADCID